MILKQRLMLLFFGRNWLTAATYFQRLVAVAAACVCVLANWWHLLEGAKLAIIAMLLMHEYKKRTGH